MVKVKLLIFFALLRYDYAMIREKFRIRIHMLAQAKVNYIQFIEKTVAMDHYFP